MPESTQLERGYPRPQLQRDFWQSLNGAWDFAIDRAAAWDIPAHVGWTHTIQVPFAPECSASGIGEPGFFQACWYRREIALPTPPVGGRLWLHFGAVDHHATVWVNGNRAREHEGGYTPFSVEITEQAGTTITVVVRAFDDPNDLAKPRGKQDWLLEPHSIWYPRTSGIWQTVWLESVGPYSIRDLRWTPNLERWEIGLDAHIDGLPRDDLMLRTLLRVGNVVLADDRYRVLASGEVSRRIALSDPGIDDYRNELLWSPRSPTLIDAELTLETTAGEVCDRARSYTALRKIGIQGHDIVLNGRPEQLRLVLDQGYWPESGLTAPNDAALRRDVELVKAMGFNGVRKHQKLEDPRFLYWADRLGLLVWAEMPSAYRFTSQSIERLTREWIAAIKRDYSHPCIVAWVPFNESWGVPNLPDIPAERHFVQSLYHLTKTLDPSRPVIGNDGWEHVATDIIGIHDYDDELERLARRYAADEMISHLFTRERPGGRLLMLADNAQQRQPIMLSEFGGIAYAADPKGIWGHSRVLSSQDLATQYIALMALVHSLSLLAGFCYTQFADTYQEANGLLYADRTPKFPLEQIREATRGRHTAREDEIDREWRERMRKFQRDTGADIVTDQA